MHSGFGLRTEDLEYLDANYPSRWQLTSPQRGQAMVGLIIEKFPIPQSYTLASSTLMLIIPNGYPGTQLDMFYFWPELVRTDGVAIKALVVETHFERQWQRWSRHYSWNPGEDSIVRHIEYVKGQIADGSTK